jgi:CheY-like chemotaxis protein
MKEAKILIVEDENIVALNLQTRLKSLGYQVAGMASTGEDAVKKCAETMPDLVLMDIMLRGEMDGVAAADQIREKYHVPVVYLTAYADDVTLERAKVTEPFGYMLKPFEVKEIRTTIEIAPQKVAISTTGQNPASVERPRYTNPAKMRVRRAKKRSAAHRSARRSRTARSSFFSSIRTTRARLSPCTNIPPVKFRKDYT